jgi:Ankyrin repeats (3 copies)
MFAAHFGHLKTVIVLCKHNADLSKVSTHFPKGDSALHLACRCMHFKVAEYLIYYGAYTNTTNEEGKTFLSYVCIGECRDKLKNAAIERECWMRRRFLLLFFIEANYSLKMDPGIWNPMAAVTAISSINVITSPSSVNTMIHTPAHRRLSSSDTLHEIEDTDIGSLKTTSSRWVYGEHLDEPLLMRILLSSRIVKRILAYTLFLFISFEVSPLLLQPESY